MVTKTLYKSGDGNATATLSAGTVSNVAVVTLPSDPGYEYDVSISVMIKAATTVLNAAVQIGGISYYSSGTSVVGSVYPVPAIATSATVLATESLYNNTATGGYPAATEVGIKGHTIKAGPAQAITCPILSPFADTYYLHYSYIGRKVIEIPSGGF